MTELDFEDVHFELGSVVDPVGKVFHFEGRLFRAISPPYSDFVQNTIELANQRKWFDAGLVPTTQSNFQLPSHSLIIEHKKIPFVTLRGEWTGEGLRDAALCILKVSAELLRSKLCLKDAHPWNVLFDATKPYFIDWGSIRPVAELNWAFWYRQFRQYLLAPLYAFSIGEPRIARAMLREHYFGVGNEIIQSPKMADLPDEPRRIAERAGSPPSPSIFEALSDYVASLNMPHVDGEWTSYGQPHLSNHADYSALREKDRIVHRLLERDNGKTLIDIGTNNGLHSEIAAYFGKRVLACDLEETCVNALYVRTRERGTDILPLHYDFLWPMGSSGVLNTIPAAEDRLSCDTVLMMAVTHHLAFKQHLTFDAMARGISKLAKRRAIVEFVPAEDVHVAQWSPERLPWYNLDNFVAAMKPHFRNHSIVDSDPLPRCVIVFEKS